MKLHLNIRDRFFKLLLKIRGIAHFLSGQKTLLSTGLQTLQCDKINEKQHAVNHIITRTLLKI